MFVKCRGGSQLPAFNFVNGWDIVPRLLDDTGIASIVEVCCAVLCCAVLCCAVLCCAVLCCAVSAMSCYICCFSDYLSNQHPSIYAFSSTDGLCLSQCQLRISFNIVANRSTAAAMYALVGTRGDSA